MASNMQPSGPPQPPRPPMMGSGAPTQNLGPPMPVQFRPVAPPQQPPQFMQPAGQQLRPVGQPMPGMPGHTPHFPQPGRHLPHSGQGPPSFQAVPMTYQQARPMSSGPMQQQQQQAAYPGGHLPTVGAPMPPPSYTFQPTGVTPPVMQPWGTAPGQSVPHVTALVQPGHQPVSAPPSITSDNSFESSSSDWQEHTATDGKKYFYNKKTRQSSWEKPVELMTPLERADASTEWKEFTAPEGRKYYYNEVTKQSKWSIPDELKIACALAEKTSNQQSYRETGTTAGALIGSASVEPTTVPVNQSSSAVGTITSRPLHASTKSVPPPGVGPSYNVDNTGSSNVSMQNGGPIPAAVSVEVPLAATDAGISRNNNENSSATSAAADTQDGTSTEDLDEAKKTMAVAGKINVTPLEEKAIEEEPIVYANKLDAKNAFKFLLESVNVESDWTWDQAIRVIINDKRYGALETLGERKQAFSEYLNQRKKIEAEEKRCKQRKAREDFLTMLEECKELTSSTRWSKAVLMFDYDERFKAVERPRERKDLFENYIVELHKKEKAKGEKVDEEAAEYEDDFDDAPLPAVRRCANASHEEEEDESDRGGSRPFPSTASDDEAVNEVSASQVLEKEAAAGEVVEAKKGAEPRKALDGRITKALAALLLLPNRKARMVALHSFKRLQVHNDLNELLIDDIIKCFCQEVRTNKDLAPCFLNFLICIAKETSFYKKCNSQGRRDFEGKLCASAGSVLDILDYFRRRKDLKELISYEQIAQVLSTWTPFCVSMSWKDLQKHPVVHKTLTKLLKYINWSTDVKGSSCSQSDVKEMEELVKQNCMMISELRRQSMVVMEKAIKQKDAAVDDSALALRESERQVKALQLEKKEMEDRLQKLQIGNIKMKDRLQEAEVYRKKLLNENLDLRGNIRVFCRVRPMIVNNIISDGLAEHIEYAESIEAKGRGIIVNKKAFLFDKVFHHTTSQRTVFDEVSNLIQSALDGYKVCILSYGQTGSGKTYTMIGYEEEKGITPRSLEKIFDCESTENKSCKYSFEVSIFEIYNNEVKDLLSPRPSDLLSPRKLKPNDETGEIPGLVVTEIFSSQHALDLLATATNKRSVAETTMNEHSSRSHLFFNIKITGINEGQKVQGRLSLVDLAGSERANNDNNHDRVTEGNKINLSLMHLGKVIQAIATKAPHIPFRNCVLTHVLKDYLGGDSKMLMLANIAQEKSSIEETLSTLKFASDVNATNIKYLDINATCAKGEKRVAPHPSKRKVGFH